MVPADVLLETLVPGYGLLARSLPSYFHVDITSYLLVIAGNLAFWAYAMPLFWSDSNPSFYCSRRRLKLAITTICMMMPCDGFLSKAP